MIASLFLFMLLLFLIGVPIAVGIGIAAALALAFVANMPMVIVPQRLFVMTDSFPLMAVPFFVLSGALMEAGGISRQLVKMAEAFVGHLTGGLAMVAIVTSMFFAAVSGSSAATVTAVGVILIPAMIAKGYDKGFAASVQACSGQMGVIIPPSIPMVVYGVVTGASVGDLFKAGVLPGILMGFSVMGVAYVFCKKNRYMGNPVKASWGERLRALREAIWALLMPVIILGGVYSGYFTPTEASAIAVGYAFIVGMFVYKGLTPGILPQVLGEAAVVTATILFLVATAGVLAWLMTRLNVPQQVATFFNSIAGSRYDFLIITNLLLFLVGMFFDAGPAIIVLAPLLAPIAESHGINLVHFGIIMIVNLAVGFCTPPVGINLFLSCQIAGIRLEVIMRYVAWFLIALIADVFIISFVPFLSMALI